MHGARRALQNSFLAGSVVGGFADHIAGGGGGGSGGSGGGGGGGEAVAGESVSVNHKSRCHAGGDGATGVGGFAPGDDMRQP